MFCEHVYKSGYGNPCILCDKDTHEIDWELYKKQRIEHREKYGLFYTVREWWSI